MQAGGGWVDGGEGEGKGRVGSRPGGSVGVAIGPVGCNLCLGRSQVQSPGGAAEPTSADKCSRRAGSHKTDTSKMQSNANRLSIFVWKNSFVYGLCLS